MTAKGSASLHNEPKTPTQKRDLSARKDRKQSPQIARSGLEPTYGGFLKSAS